MSHFTLRQTPQPIQWATLLGASVVCVAAFELMRLPAALMLGAIGAAILLCWFEGKVTIPPWGFVIAQGFIGCLVARAITTDIVITIFQRWPMFLVLIGAVIVFAAALGYVLTRLKVLPGTTAVWGSSAGAATAMVLMSDAFGGDMRLVAVMQYLRVACVGLVASLIARASLPAGAAAPASIVWFPPLAPGPLLATLALGVGGAVIGVKSKLPAGALLVPMFVGAPLSASHLLTITLPPWLLAICYALVGWSIGLRFTRETVLYAWKQLPVILVSIFTLIALCGGLAFALHEAAGTDVLTAYLATSPGGADAVAIIAASSRVDLPFVMAMQIGRLLVALLVGPTLARTIARWAGSDAAPSSVQSAK
jgi:membrane AbrB-like protein